MVEPVVKRFRRKEVKYFLTDGEFEPPARSSVVDGLKASLRVELPKDYTEFLKQHNGGEGFVNDSYIIFFKAEELVDFNREYEVEKYAPGILLFASNGGGEAYGFDTQDPNMSIVRVPFVGMSRKLALKTARNIAELFSRLSE
jgi:hypothetical protein